MTSLHMFVGPTAHGVESSLDLFEVHPPVARGQIDLLVQNQPHPGTLAIVDGTFHSYPSVSHQELLRAIRCGWSVWGLSSMGAIRACELDHFGMRGFGAVYQGFKSGTLMDDDEVTLLHTEEPYVAVSVPLVSVRSALEAGVRSHIISDSQRLMVLALMKGMWFGYRNEAILGRFLNEVGAGPDATRTIVGSLTSHDVKQSDLTDFVQMIRGAIG